MSTTAAIRVPTQERAVRTRAALLAAAAVEFSTHGYAATTARSIAERAGVATGSFYQYFADKDATLRELSASRLAGVGERVLAALDEDLAGPRAPEVSTVRRCMRAVVEAVADLHRADVGLHAVLTERRHADHALDHATSAAERAMVARVAALLVRWDHRGDAEALAFVLFGMVEGAVHAQFLGAKVVPDARFSASLVDALVRVATPPALRTAVPRAPSPRPRKQRR